MGIEQPEYGLRSRIQNRYHLASILQRYAQQKPPGKAVASPSTDETANETRACGAILK